MGLQTPSRAADGSTEKTALSRFDIRSKETGLVVCKRVIDLCVPEGRCIGYASAAVPAANDIDDDSLTNSHLDPRDSLASLTALASPNHWIRNYLHPLEVQHAVEECPSENGRASFLLGRLALRQALASIFLTMTRGGAGDGSEDPTAAVHAAIAASITYSAASSLSPSFVGCLLRDGHGRPHVPDGYLGSVSHKKNVAVALVACRDHHDSSCADAVPRGIGVDLERARSRNKISIAPKVLTPQEMQELGNVPVREGRPACVSTRCKGKAKRICLFGLCGRCVFASFQCA
jgi:hypothetical protein